MHFLVVFGTRPEAIKMYPVIKELKKEKRHKVTVLVTGQHREMLEQVLSVFGIKPDINLNVMDDAGSVEGVVALTLTRVSAILENLRPDVMIVHGDTATTLGASLSAYFSKIKIAHVEAGLRTFDLYSPWPEEGNRKLVGALADFHFAPTIASKHNLLKEGVLEKKIHVVGNTVIDSLLFISDDNKRTNNVSGYFEREYPEINLDKRFILVTGHRRENFGEGFRNICRALDALSAKYKDVEIIYPVHLNPNVRAIVLKNLAGRVNIHLIEPLDYRKFVFLMEKSYLILTDSGGIQEEAPSLNKPVLLMRDTTERPEGVHAGTVRIVGTSVSSIVNEVSKLMDDPETYSSVAFSKNPYGDGNAGQKIKKILLEQLEE